MKAVLLALVLVLAATNVRSQTTPALPNVVVRTTTSPTNGAIIGQPIRLFVDVLFLGRMPWPPRVAIGDVAGAQVFRFETQGVTRRDSIMGDNYVGQRFEFMIYPRRGGQLFVPPAAVTLLDANGDPAGSAAGEQTRLDIGVPPGVDASQPVVAADSFTLQEEWAPDPNSQFKAGDVLVRTVTRTAADIPSLALRDLAFDAPVGVRVYIDPPASNDTVERGQVVGRRIDRTTYVFETAGRFVLPDVTQPWWQLGARTLRRAIGEGHAVTVSAPDQDSSKWWDMDWRAWRSPTTWTVLATAILGITLLAVCISWAVRWMRVALTERHRHWVQSEAKAFRDLSDACRGADLGLIYRAFTIWRDRLPVSARSAVMQLSAKLLDALFRGDVTTKGIWSEVNSQALLANLQQFRAAVRREVSTSPPSALPPLNPTS